MDLKGRVLVVCLLLSAFFLSAFAVAVTLEDPELKQCKHQCKHQRGFEEWQKQQCERKCEDYIKQKREQEEQRRRWEGGGGEGGSFYIREREEFEGRGQQQQQQGDENPYFFEDQHFETRVQTEEGRVQVLQKFNERSDLLRGIENFRVGFLVTEPHAFVSPTHLDADCTPFYILNRDENERLHIVELLKTVSTPGEYEAFHSAGGQDPESFFKAFSPEVLQAAFKTDRNKLDRLFGQQRRGSIVRASKEQVQRMSQQHGHGGSEGIWPLPFHGGESSKDSFNLFKKHPSQENKFGRLFEADFKDFKQLQEFDLLVSFANITRGAMEGPFFNSRATKISVVLDGEGHFEMACPHVAKQRQQSGRSQQRQKSSPTYQKMSGDLRRGAVFVAPAGHPVTTIASRNNNLQLLCFEVNARDNIRFPLVGKNNVVSQFDRQAKELSFNVPASEVESIFNNQKDELFFEGPNEQPQHGLMHES
ncbi:hypothetical protein C1H46_019259 [Malus baccata]|uniref:Cupin type-1 domain-containing protein n=1 Tax=Malus baccata TaxID=106549 RepID=A0A540M8M4_MALBA|nr:hypothetical protein C1H46_019259 [Malus baccata]